VLNKSILSKASPDCWRAFERVTNKENSLSLDGDLKRCIVTKNRLHVGRANQTNGEGTGGGGDGVWGCWLGGKVGKVRVKKERKSKKATLKW
jgi:hypothetical protein